MKSADSSLTAAAASASARPTTRRSRLRSRFLIYAVTGAITVSFSYIALRDLNPGRVWHALRATDYQWLIPALLAFGFAVVARAMRWRVLFAPGRRPSRRVVLNATTIGYFYNNILPARAGEAARVVVLTRRSATPSVEIVGTVVLERVYDVVTILAIFFVAEPWLPHVSWFGTAASIAIALVGLIAATTTVLAVYGDRPLRLLLRPLLRFSFFSDAHLDRTVAEVAYGLGGLRDVRIAVEALLWTLVAWMLSALCAYLVSLSFDLHLSFACGVLVAVAVGASMILPSPPAAIGVFEGATLIALRAYDVPHSVALSYALVLHAINCIPFIVAGMGLLHYNARHPRRIGDTDGSTSVSPAPAVP